jgi:SPP1 family predicted phage head-tail adaptor
MIGSMRERVEIQSLATSRDELGSITETWSELATVWASVRSVSAREYYAARQVNAEVTHRVAIRYRSDVTPLMRLIWGSRTLEIVSALDKDGRERFLELLCTEVVG